MPVLIATVTAAFHVVIPARYASTRLPGKPLIDLDGKPMVLRVVDRSQKAPGVGEVWVATDHADIERCCRDAGVKVMRTRSDHVSGTDRLAEVADRLGWDDDQLVINVQGDEPLIDPAHIALTATTLRQHQTTAIATLVCPLVDRADYLSPNVVKVVCRQDGRALYFSRAPIPCWRDAPQGALPNANVRRHIGLYAYRRAFLRAYASLPACPLEQSESLEQLRALWYGYDIAIAEIAQQPHPGVDTPADAERVRAWFKAQR